MMKRLLLTSVAFAALIVAPATAADLARPVYRAPMVVAAPIYTWTGFYVGGNVGGSWGDARTDTAASATTVTFPGTSNAFTNPPATFADSQAQRLNGVIGGVQVGYNYQFSPALVLGFEADIQSSSERGSNRFVDPFSSTICSNSGPISCLIPTLVPFNGTATTAYEAKIGWFGTVRGRLGVLLADQVLLYATGGLAYGQVSVSANTYVNGTVSNVFPPTPPGVLVVPFVIPGTSALSTSKTNVGFAVGLGMEAKCSYLLPTGWTWKLEYLYVDLGSLDTVSAFPAALPVLAVFVSPLTGTFSTHTHFTDNIVRVGLNYKFGEYAPVITR